MKHWLIIGILIFVTASYARAETAYISEVMEITLRTGPGTDHKIVSMLASGQEVETLEQSGGWTRVNLPDGKTGWVLTRFVSKKMPDRVVLTRLQQAHDELLQKSAAPLEEINRLTAENNMLSSKLVESEKTLAQLQQKHVALKKESSDFLKVKADYETAASGLAEQTQKAEKLENELAKFELHQNIKWFLSGAGVLILGFIIGYSTKRQRRRSSLL